MKINAMKREMVSKPSEGKLELLCCYKVVVVVAIFVNLMSFGDRVQDVEKGSMYVSQRNFIEYILGFG